MAEIKPELASFRYGADQTEQLAARISYKSFTGEPFVITGIVCPLYVVDGQKLSDKGFKEGVVGIGEGDLEEFPRYKAKTDRFLRLATKLVQILPTSLQTKVVVHVGDIGVIGASRAKKEYRGAIRLFDLAESNQQTYKRYFAKQNLGFSVGLGGLSFVTQNYGLDYPFPDLHEMGRNVSNYDFPFVNTDVSRKIADEQLVLSGREYIEAETEPAGFGLAYGLAGLGLRQHGADILIGTDAPGSYLNYLYHAYMDSSELLVLVPKEANNE